MPFFHPRYLNDELSFEALAAGALSFTGMQDRFLLRRFLDGEGLRARVAQLEALSAQRQIARINAPIVLLVGSLETPEFQRQTREFADALTRAGKSAELIYAEG